MKAMPKTVLAAAAMLVLLPGLAWAVPTANNQSITVPPGLASPGKLISLSYSGASGATSFTIVSQPAHGTLTRYSPTSYPQYYYYLPDAGYQGPDPFTWKAADSTGTSNTATYSITVANTIPVANPQSLTVSGAGSYSFSLSVAHADFGQTMTYTRLSGPNHGTLAAPSDSNRWTYTPAAGFAGQDTFTWKCSDGFGDSNTATCTLTVNCIAPVPQDSTAAVKKGVTTDIPAKYTGGNGYTLAFAKVTSPSASAGTVTAVGDKFRYVPAANFTGTISFTWKITYSNATTPATSTATVKCTLKVMDDSIYGKDWPMWARDEHREQTTLHDVPATLYLQWRRDYRPTVPAWSALAPRKYELGYEPVVMGNMMFVGLNAQDAVVALDTNTGAELWRFYTDGPVRTAPVALSPATGSGSTAKVYVASDDGHLYCLKASDGSLVWKRRAGPSSRKCLGNQRLISVWPVRCGPVASDGIVYFGSGVFNLEGYFWYALDAETGDVVWDNDGMIASGRGAHSEAPPPTGNLVVSSDGTKLHFQGGYEGTATLDRWTGELLSQGTSMNTASSYATCDGGNLDAWPVNIVTGVRQWGVSDVTALGVTGSVYRILSADDKLFVVTTQGSIYCFGGAQVSPRTYPVQTTPLPDLNDSWESTVASILSTTGANQGGCALVFGVGSGRAVEELVRQGTMLHVVVVDPDPAKIAALRTKFSGAGLYGTRVSAHVGSPKDWGVPPYIGRLIISEDVGAAGFPDGQAFVEEMFKHIRPFGGTMWFATTTSQHASLGNWVAAAALPNAQFARDGGFSVLTRVGALPGAMNPNADGTHPGNWDTAARSPMGLLWWQGTSVYAMRTGFSKDGGLGGSYDAYTGFPCNIGGTGIVSDESLAATSSSDPDYGFGTRINALTGLREKIPPKTLPAPWDCQPAADYKSHILGFRSEIGWYDRNTDSGFVRMLENRIYCTIPGGGTSMAHGLIHASATYCRCKQALPHWEATLVHVPEAENWAEYGNDRSRERVEEDPIRKMGVNFGAPGDRMDDGTLWVEAPYARNRPAADGQYGYETYDYSMGVRVGFTPNAVTRFTHDASRIQEGGSKRWVASSGVVGATKIAVHLGYPPVALRAASAPVIDGSLADSCWDGRKPSQLGGYAAEQAFFRYDDANLYIALNRPVPRLGDCGEWTVSLADRGRFNTSGDIDGEVVLSLGMDGSRKVNGLAPVAGDWTDRWTGKVVAPSTGSMVLTGEMAIPWEALEAAGIWRNELVINTKVIGAGHDRVRLRMNGYCPLYFDTMKGLCGAERAYTVRLYFTEPDDLIAGRNVGAGERVFDVKLQGQTVLSNFDIVQAAGGIRRSVVREFRNVIASDVLEIGLVPKAGQPLICGAEIVGTYGEIENLPPVAALVASPISGTAPLMVEFDARGSSDPDGQIAGCGWNFGDGESGRGWKTSHTFAGPGTYTVVLAVSDERGATGTASKTITVTGVVPPADFVCRIRASGGDYAKLSAWETAVQSDLTLATSMVFPVSNRGTYALADDGTAVTFTGGGTGTLRHINTANMAYIVGCAGTIQAGTVTCASGRAFTVADTGRQIGRAIAECYNDWPAGLSDRVVVDGWKANADHYIKIHAPVSERHTGKGYDASGNFTGFAIVGNASGYTLDIRMNYTRLEGLIVKGGGSAATRGGVSLTWCNRFETGIVFQASGTGASVNCMGGDVRISNTVIAGDRTGCGLRMAMGGYQKNCAYNVTITNGVGKGLEVATPTATIRARNVLATGNAGGDFVLSTGIFDIANCASGDATADDWDGVFRNENAPQIGNPANRINQVFGLADPANGDCHLRADDTGARDRGCALGGDLFFPVFADIDGALRQGAWDIGADEASGSTVPVKPAITSSLTASGTVGQAFSYTITASGTAPITFGATGLPAGLSRSGAAINGTPTTAGTNNVTLTATNSVGTDTKTLVLTVAAANNAPVVSTWDPATPFSMAAGTTQVFEVWAHDVDGDALTYSWKLDDTPTGNTGSSMTYSPTAANAGSHTIQVTVSDGKGVPAVQTWAVTVTVPTTPPSITTQPASKTVAVGATATFTVVATGTAPISYQWQKNGVNIGGATSASYTTPATTSADNGAKFKVVVTNSAGSATSTEATLTVNALPTYTITASPGTGGTISPSGAVAVSQDGSQTFVIAASGGYQIASVTVDGSSVGAVTSYTFTNVTANHAIAAAFSAIVVAPSITTQPASQTVTAGQTAAFSVVASGTAPLSYQWQKNGVNISGATSASYTTPATVLADNGAKFKVVVTNSAGSATSSEATLTVQSGGTPGLLWLRARDQYGAEVPGAQVQVYDVNMQLVGTYAAGTQVQFVVGKTYRFQGVLSGVGGSTVTVVPTSSTTEVPVGFWKTTIRCRDQYGADVSGAKVQLNPLYSSTVLGTYVPGGTVTLPRGAAVHAFVQYGGITGPYSRPTFDTGLEELVGALWKATCVAKDAGGNPVSGASIRLTQPNYGPVIGTYASGTAVTLPAGIRAWAYMVVGSSTGAKLDVTFQSPLTEVAPPAPGAVVVAPSITTQPGGRTVTVGQTATFSVAASGTAPLSYQWQKNGVNISGATSSSYTTPATVIGDNGAKFKVVVTNSAGSVTSTEATLTVNAVPTYTVTASAGTGGTISPSGSVTVNQGASQTFTVAASGGYQIAGVTVDGASVGAVTSYTFTNVTASHTIAAAFSAIVVAPSITTQPAGKTVAVGATATFTVVASGTAPLSYQWQKNGVNIGGATAASYTTSATVLADNGAKFKVVVANSAGSATSNEATLTVQSGGTPGLLWLRARDQYGAEVPGAQVQVCDVNMQLVGIYAAGTQVQLVVGKTYRFQGLMSGVSGPLVTLAPTSTTSEVVIGFWKTTVRCRDQYGADVSGAQVRINVRSSSTQVGVYSAGAVLMLPRGAGVDVLPQMSGCTGACARPTFDTGLDELVGQFWKTTIRCRDQNGADVAGAKVRINVAYSSAQVGLYNAGDSVTVPRGCVVDALPQLSVCTGARTQPKFDTGLEELVGSFWKATCVAKDAAGNVVSGAAIRLVLPYSTTVVGQYASGTEVTLPNGTPLWAYMVVGSSTGAKLDVTFKSPLAEVSPLAP